MINDLRTIFKVVTGRKQVKDKPRIECGSKSRKSTKSRNNLKITDNSYEKDEEKQYDTFYGICRGEKGEDTIPMSFGLVVTVVNGGGMESV
ncbi:hypothetical protein GOBAR_DD04279 [Gossypium barbadense]|nr:hypothetical protein GOBAR_DD04279 [Gossypium barbadense]